MNISGVIEQTSCAECLSLLHEALNLTVRGRNLDAINRRAGTLAASKDPDAWKAHGLFDKHCERHNAQCEPWQRIETKSLTPQLWLEDQFQRDLFDWETRARKHMMEEHQ